MQAESLFPIFLKLQSRPVLVVGGGVVATGKVEKLVSAGAHVTVVAPKICKAIMKLPVTIEKREFVESDLDGVWFVVAAAPPEVNQIVSVAGGARRVFVNAVDDPENASAYAASVISRGPIMLAISTSGLAPALSALLREALDSMLPVDLEMWLEESVRERSVWQEHGVPMEDRRERLLARLNEIYQKRHSGREVR
jgi:siroheme synthase-like protein